MRAEQLDAAFGVWMATQPDYLTRKYHIQVKLVSGEVGIAQLTAAELTGWVIIDWQHRGRGLSQKQALPTSRPIDITQQLNILTGDLLHAQFQLVIAPGADWADSYPHDSLAPDLLPVLDAGHSIVLSVSAEREDGNWRVISAHQPPDDKPLTGFQKHKDG